MEFVPVDRVDHIDGRSFREAYLKPSKPLVIRNLSKGWAANTKWNLFYFKSLAGNIEVPLYDNRKPAPNSAVNAPDAVMTFGEYLDLIASQPSELRMFLFNIFKHIPSLCDDFSYPEELMGGFLKKYPMMFFGGSGSKVYLHYDMDLSHVFITQFTGRKKVILFDNSYSRQLYRLPFMVQSYIDPENPDYTAFPALKNVKGYITEIGHGETLFMPSGMWQYMFYTEGGYALSLRSIDVPVTTKIRGVYNLFVMRNIDDFLKKSFPQRWYDYKHSKAAKLAMV